MDVVTAAHVHSGEVELAARLVAIVTGLILLREDALLPLVSLSQYLLVLVLLVSFSLHLLLAELFLMLQVPGLRLFELHLLVANQQPWIRACTQKVKDNAEHCQWCKNIHHNCEQLVTLSQAA